MIPYRRMRMALCSQAERWAAGLGLCVCFTVARYRSQRCCLQRCTRPELTLSAWARLLTRVSSATDATEWCTDRPTRTMLGLYALPFLQFRGPREVFSHS